MAWARILFDKRKTPALHSETPKELVTDGPFKFTRNPLYVGGLTFLLGVGISVGTLPFLIVPFIMFGLLQWVYIPWEEKLMAELFKDQYINYKKTTRRWI